MQTPAGLPIGPGTRSKRQASPSCPTAARRSFVPTHHRKGYQVLPACPGWAGRIRPSRPGRIPVRPGWNGRRSAPTRAGGLVVVDFLDHAIEVVERTVDHANHLAWLEQHLRLRASRRLPARAAGWHPPSVADRQRAIGGAADEAHHLRGFLHQMPGTRCPCAGCRPRRGSRSAPARSPGRTCARSERRFWPERISTTSSVGTSTSPNFDPACPSRAMRSLQRLRHRLRKRNRRDDVPALVDPPIRHRRSQPLSQHHFTARLDHAIEQASIRLHHDDHRDHHHHGARGFLAGRPHHLAQLEARFGGTRGPHALGWSDRMNTRPPAGTQWRSDRTRAHAHWATARSNQRCRPAAASSSGGQRVLDDVPDRSLRWVRLAASLLAVQNVDPVCARDRRPSVADGTPGGLEPQPAVLETAALPIELLAYRFPRYSVPGPKTAGGFAPPVTPFPGPRKGEPGPLLDDLGDHAGADGTAALADGEAQAFVHRHRAISDTTIFMLSPGITISTPSGNSTAPSRRSCGSRTAGGSP